MSEINCGRIGMHTMHHCAHKAAIIIKGFDSPRAVCIAPDGHVTVESPNEAIPDEMAGVYSPDVDRESLGASILDDMAVLQRELRIVGGRNHRVRVNRGAA